MKPYAARYRCSFVSQIENHLAVGGDQPIEESVQLVLTDPAYNCRRKGGDENASHDVLAETNMKEEVRIIANILRKGGHAHLFCSVQQFNI